MMNIFLNISDLVRCFSGFFLALAIVLLFGKRFISFLIDIKMSDNVKRTFCEKLHELHKNKNNTPTMGGLLIFIAVISSVLICARINFFVIVSLLSIIFFTLIGCYDDWLKLKYNNKNGLSGRRKMIYQGIIAIGVITAMIIRSRSGEICFGLNIPFMNVSLFSSSIIWKILVFLLMVKVIVGSSNAVNLTDGLDGLASGLIIMSATLLSIFALNLFNSGMLIFDYQYAEGMIELAVVLSALSGAFVGFLWFNCKPAKMFMGDTGSLCAGGLLGVSAVLLKQEILFAIVGGVFVAEALSVILQVASCKLRKKKRIFLCTPLHHHFEYKGLDETEITMKFWIIGALLFVIGLAAIC